MAVRAQTGGSQNPREYHYLGPQAPVIAAAAIAHGLDPRVALAVAHGEGGFAHPAPRGDNNTSFGPFQMHMGGALPSVYDGRPDAADKWANSPEGINFAVARIASVTRGMQGQAAIDAAVRDFERPANPTPEVQGDVRFYNALAAGRGTTPFGGSAAAGGATQPSPGQAGGFPTKGGGQAGVAPGTVPNVFDSCKVTGAGPGGGLPIIGGVVGTATGFLTGQTEGGILCYVTGVLKITALGVGGVVVMGVGFYLMLPRYRATVNKATLGAAGAAVSLTPGGRAAKAASAATAARAGERREASAKAKGDIERARVSHARARARESRARARAAEQHVRSGDSLYSPAENRKISRAQAKHPKGGRPDRVKG